mmetsp:Transcript_4542/g.8475  ORF Transcript_4542/g.8475 Transcript_4542/m.8475 type:complete len:229 (+) Transcript_4542:1164-1850(+)
MRRRDNLGGQARRRTRRLLIGQLGGATAGVIAQRVRLVVRGPVARRRLSVGRGGGFLVLPLGADVRLEGEHEAEAVLRAHEGGHLPRLHALHESIRDGMVHRKLVHHAVQQALVVGHGGRDAVRALGPVAVHQSAEELLQHLLAAAKLTRLLHGIRGALARRLLAVAPAAHRLRSRARRPLESPAGENAHSGLSHGPEETHLEDEVHRKSEARGLVPAVGEILHAPSK